MKDEENVVDGSILAEGAADEASVSLDYSPQLGDTDQIPVLASFLKFSSDPAELETIWMACDTCWCSHDASIMRHKWGDYTAAPDPSAEPTLQDRFAAPSGIEARFGAPCGVRQDPRHLSAPDIGLDLAELRRAVSCCIRMDILVCMASAVPDETRTVTGDSGCAGVVLTMKIATFNVNNINRRLPNLLRWLKDARPDIVCLQELKSTDAGFPADDIRRVGYKVIWKAQKTWNGVAILSRGVEPVVTRTALPGDLEDKQSRYIEAAVNDVLVGCIYLPNGNPQPGPKFDYKLAWFKRLQVHANKLLKGKMPVVLAGDYNVAPTEMDIYPTTSWDNDALVQPESRAAYAKLVGQGWTDAIRELYPEERIYTFWHYWRNSWQRNAGLRIDHFLLSPALAKRLDGAGVDRDMRGRNNPSDHAPVWIKLKDGRSRKRR